MTSGYFSVSTDPGDGGAAEQFVPAPHANGPWSNDMLHGRLLGGLAARALERDFGGDGWRCARLTVDLFRPAAMAPVTVVTSPVRTGRKVQVVDAMISCGGHEVGRATAVFLTVGEEPPGRIWSPADPEFPSPDSVSSDGHTGAAEDDNWMFRVVRGGMSTGERTAIWTNETLPLVGDEPMSPLVRSAVSGDIACPLANSSDKGLYFINADYTMLLGRYPVGDWIGLEVSERMGANGISIAAATLVDEQGPFATSGGTSLARPPLDG